MADRFARLGLLGASIATLAGPHVPGGLSESPDQDIADTRVVAPTLTHSESLDFVERFLSARNVRRVESSRRGALVELDEKSLSTAGVATRVDAPAANRVASDREYEQRLLDLNRQFGTQYLSVESAVTVLRESTGVDGHVVLLIEERRVQEIDTDGIRSTNEGQFFHAFELAGDASRLELVDWLEVDTPQLVSLLSADVDLETVDLALLLSGDRSVGLTGRCAVV